MSLRCGSPTTRPAPGDHVSRPARPATTQPGQQQAAEPRFIDAEFQREAEQATSTTFVAYVRWAAEGGRTAENTNPFGGRDELITRFPCAAWPVRPQRPAVAAQRWPARQAGADRAPNGSPRPGPAWSFFSASPQPSACLEHDGNDSSDGDRHDDQVGEVHEHRHHAEDHDDGYANSERLDPTHRIPPPHLASGHGAACSASAA